MNERDSLLFFLYRLRHVVPCMATRTSRVPKGGTPEHGTSFAACPWADISLRKCYRVPMGRHPTGLAFAFRGCRLLILPAKRPTVTILPPLPSCCRQLYYRTLKHQHGVLALSPCAAGAANSGRAPWRAIELLHDLPLRNNNDVGLQTLCAWHSPSRVVNDVVTIRYASALAT